MGRSEQNFEWLKEYNKNLEEALYRVIDAGRLDVAKEHAADALGIDLEDHMAKDLDELNFLDSDFDGELDYSLLDEDD